MFNNKGMTLIESLFALEIFLSVLVIYTSLFITIFNQESKLNEKFKQIQTDEICIQVKNELSEIVEMVLH